VEWLIEAAEPASGLDTVTPATTNVYVDAVPPGAIETLVQLRRS
jgi:hypothetical protein